jgi:threonylcarbamoyladenosine tRNA methylthiotransferase MtaB
VGLTTVGCKLNQYDTELIREQFVRAGYDVVPFDARADVYVVNSCTVTSRSDRDSRRLARRAKRRNPDACVVLTGCYAEVSTDAVAGIPEIDLVVGNADKRRLADLVAADSTKHGAGPTVHRSDIRRCTAFDEPLVSSFSTHTRAFMKVQDGCDAACTYCIVRRARGRSRSLPPERAVEQAKRLADAGHAELVLVGVHLGAYGLDLAPPLRLADLVAQLVQVPGIGRIRLSSIEPHEVDEGLISLAASSPNVCRHFHIPVQSGDDDLLRRMNRPYTSGFVAELLTGIAARIPGAGIGADVIVGFPGEAQRHFEHTHELLRALPVTYLHVFSYSPRPGTAAAGFADQVQEDVKKRRCQALRRLSAQKALAFRRMLLGTTAEVLVEGARTQTDGTVTGLTDNYVRVALEDSQDSRLGAGQMLVARLVGIRPNGLVAAVPTR